LKNSVREAFCYLCRLTLADKFDQLLRLVPPDEQECLSAIWTEIEQMSDEEVRQHFIRLRQTETKVDE